MEEETKLIWHKDYKNPPKKKGWYLCKLVDLENCEEPYEWSEPYYNVVWYDSYWDCDGVPVAWAEIPGCSFEME